MIISHPPHKLFAKLAMILAVASAGGALSTPLSSQGVSNPQAPTGIQAESSQPQPLMTAEQFNERLIAAYGAVLLAKDGTIPPPGIMFADEDAVTSWQAGVPTEKATLANITIELQTPALRALLEAREELQKTKLDVSPYARDAARRSYADTVRLWKKRVEAGLYHWYKKGRLARTELRRIRALAPQEQAIEVFRLEAEGLYFSTNLKKTILSSSAPPGASQHLAMLALDVKQHEQAKMRAALARHGWFQTVAGDFTHFTYLGCKEEDLPALGLKKVVIDKRSYWVPDRPAKS